MASRPSGQDLLVGIELGHYRIVEKIGAGGMGEVYRARDQHLARDVAIKVLPPGTLIDEHARKRFRNEAFSLSKLNHPNIATIHDFDTQQGVDFLVMEYIPGITLSEKVAAGPLPEKEVLRLGVQLAEGLAAAHEHGVVHRDLKPGNLQITSDARLKFLDFGLARLRLPVTASATTESLSETHAMAGTLPYMAPEQLLGAEIDARTDIHAAGSVLYEMATGQRPFGKLEHAQLIAAILRQAPAPPGQLNPQLSPELARIIGKCLEKEPENRYQSAKELAIDLRRLLTPSAAKVAEVPVAGRKLWKVLVPAALLLLAAAVGGTLYFGLQRAHALTDRDTIVLSDFDNKTDRKSVV
jgi:serine/threonine protein kinase